MKAIKILIIIMVILNILGLFCIAHAGVTDKKLVKDYCVKHYPKYKIVYFTKWNEKKILHRKGKKIVYVEKSYSYSHGWYGLSKEGYYTCYNKKVKEGKKVTTYCIYNPYTNYVDDIVAVVDNKMIRY